MKKKLPDNNKNNVEEIIAKNIIDINFEDIIGKCFGRYAKYIIQERALPDIRDGLKPVQRRIIFAMYSLKLTSESQFKKSARIVGEVIGKYHPHGDTSVYDALVRMSQPWKFLHPLIWMHGNNGSIDGDSAAAMRYTEAKLAKICDLLIGDIDKDTITYQDNFDESEKEPVVFPSKIPNLLINGCTGIAAGYATDIPPHNLEEIINALIYRLKNPNCLLEDLLKIVAGPDFPTGCSILGTKGIKDAYETGKGKIIIESKYQIIESAKNEYTIEFLEIPYNVLKSNIIKEIYILKEKHNLSIINDIRDDSGKNGLKIVVIVKSNYENTQKLLNYLLCNTSLRINYSFNMVAIINSKPKLSGLLEIIDQFINFQKEITINACQHDLNNASNKLEIIQGIIKAMGILDDVIKLIRKAKSRQDVIEKLMQQLSFSEKQASAIADLKLYRLSSTDVSMLHKDQDKLEKNIKRYRQIIENLKVLNNYITSYLGTISKEFNRPRLSKIVHKDDYLINKVNKVVIEEKVQCFITRDGYLKNISVKSKNASLNLDTIITKENDIIIFSALAKNTDYLLIITNQGNYLFLQLHEIKIVKEKDLGTSIFDLRKVKGPEQIIFATLVKDYNPNTHNIADINILFLTKFGKTKMSNLLDFNETKLKAMQCFKLNEDDMLVSTVIANKKYALILTNLGNYTFFEVSQVSIFGIKTGGISALKLNKNEYIRELLLLNDNEDLAIILTNGEMIAKNMLNLKLTKRNRNPLAFPKTTPRNKARYLISLNSLKHGYWMYSPELKKPPLYLSKINTSIFKSSLKKFNKLTANIIIIQNNIIKSIDKENE